MTRLARGQLHGIGSGLYDRVDRALHVLDPGEKSRLVEKPVVDGHVKAASGFRVEETVQSVCFHKACCPAERFNPG
jgi:hypothetical protein